MNINEAFPSTFLKAADIGDSKPTVTIDRVEMQDIGDDHKPVVYFEGKDKGIVLNKTNANNIADAFGPDTDDWTGQQVQLFTTLVDFQGRSVEAIRVRAAKPTGSKTGAKTTVPPRFESENPASAMSDDDIPF